VKYQVISSELAISSKGKVTFNFSPLPKSKLFPVIEIVTVYVLVFSLFTNATNSNIQKVTFLPREEGRTGDGRGRVNEALAIAGSLASTEGAGARHPKW